MKSLIPLTLLIFSTQISFSQDDAERLFSASYMNIQTVDSSRIYKANTEQSDSLHYRPVNFDIWYPSSETPVDMLSFFELLSIFERCASRYQESSTLGVSQEIIDGLVAVSGHKSEETFEALKADSRTGKNLQSIDEASPVIIYMSGQNGASFENYPIFEHLAENGYVVISIWSVGRYPGVMTNMKEDLIEQVLDAEFALKQVRQKEWVNIDPFNVGLIGYSWGGMGVAALNERMNEIKASVSLDGSETHYFGESDKDDKGINDIIDAGILKPENHRSAYIYLESGKDFSTFREVVKYDYYEKIPGKKFYVRFLTSSHEDFSYLPSLLRLNDESISRYADLKTIIKSFFDEELKKKATNSFINGYVKRNENLSTIPIESRRSTIATRNIKGRVIDDENGEPVPYVNLGFPLRMSGTVSDAEGWFSLEIDDKEKEDTLIVSCTGYNKIGISIGDLAGIELIKLTKSQERLQEVVIESKGLKEAVIGNRARSKFISTPFGYKHLGAEMGVKMQVKHAPTYVEAFNVNIPHNRLRGRAIFRLNIYNIKDDKPDRSILDENILIPIESEQTGKVAISLKDYNIVLREDVIVCLEWVGHDGTLERGDGINFSLGFFNGATYVRYVSQAPMEKKFGMGVGFSLDVKY